MQRREMFLGLTGLLVTPAIVRASSLMPISVPRSRFTRYVVEITTRGGGHCTVIGGGPITDLLSPAVIAHQITRAIPWASENFAQDLEIRLLREDESALTYWKRTFLT